GYKVTGVQTCALPILRRPSGRTTPGRAVASVGRGRAGGRAGRCRGRGGVRPGRGRRRRGGGRRSAGSGLGAGRRGRGGRRVEGNGSAGASHHVDGRAARDLFEEPLRVGHGDANAAVRGGIGGNGRRPVYGDPPVEEQRVPQLTEGADVEPPDLGPDVVGAAGGQGVAAQPLLAVVPPRPARDHDHPGQGAAPVEEQHL